MHHGTAWFQGSKNGRYQKPNLFSSEWSISKGFTQSQCDLYHLNLELNVHCKGPEFLTATFFELLWVLASNLKCPWLQKSWLPSTNQKPEKRAMFFPVARSPPGRNAVGSSNNTVQLLGPLKGFKFDQFVDLKFLVTCNWYLELLWCLRTFGEVPMKKTKHQIIPSIIAS